MFWELQDDEKREILSRLLAHTEMPEGVDGCWLSTYFLDEWGYGRIQIKKSLVGGKRHGKAFRVHIVAHQLVNGGVDPLTDEFPWALHWCGDARCWKPDHLYSGTAKQNTEDMFRHGSRNRPKCGTPSGWNQHIKDGTPSCNPCRDAHNKAKRDDRRKRNGTN